MARNPGRLRLAGQISHLGLRVALLLLSIAATAWASGPRWVTGPPYFTAPAGTPVAWYTKQPHYFTDPGDLSAAVNHASADALVAAAAGVWNVPTSMLTLAQGGTLAEHVSGANAYLGSSGPVFPADVQASNYAAIQIAVIYDSDGSVTDLLLGGGASAPAECRQNGVTGSVDSIVPAGYIQHAIVVLNGRCTGPAPEQQLQLRYQLERAFGRVLGLGWSQTNDNVFTGTPQPTNNQALHWPILHPIDIVCGPYTYQCLPQPFTLRDDDVASISSLYPSGLSNDPSAAQPPAGKIWTYTQASLVEGTVTFPTGQGMQGVNVVVQRQQGGWNIPEAWYETSSVTGYRFQQNAENPVTRAATGLAGSMGSSDPALEGYYELGWVPDIDPPNAPNGPMFVKVTTEAINPLYAGANAVGPYVLGSVAPSGAPETQLMNHFATGPLASAGVETSSFAPPDAAATCNSGSDGVESSPLPVAAGGWWTGVLCAHGHTAWSSFPMQGGRTATVEVTALDESGFATTAKAMPLIGAWAAGDATGTLPTITATPAAFNTIALGTTAANISTTQSQSLRLVIADARGDGRPDFAYQARVLYADSVTPAAISLSGGQIAIAGMGFRQGNEVLVNGVAAQVTSWSATSILVIAPPESAFTAQPNAPVNIAVVDLETGGSTAMTAALTYSNSVAPDQIKLVSAPTGPVPVGTAAGTPFAVRVLQGDGVTPAAGLPVTFSVPAGTAQLSCAAAHCLVLTDATGLASVTVTPTAYGTVTLQASAAGVSLTASFLAVAQSLTIAPAVEYVAAGASVAWTPQATLTQNAAPAAGVAVTWTAQGAVTLAPASSVSNASGMDEASAVAGPLAAAAQAQVQACAWGNICATGLAQGVDPSAWRVVVVSGAGQTIVAGASFAPVVAMVTDTSGNPVAGAAVAIYQTANAAEQPCPARGRCPVSPMLTRSTGQAVSDGGGMVRLSALQVAGFGEVTDIAIAAGTQGFASLSLTQKP